MTRALPDHVRSLVDEIERDIGDPATAHVEAIEGSLADHGTSADGPDAVAIAVRRILGRSARIRIARASSERRNASTGCISS
jgi:hypothetical protein